jgi:predicted aminopeptidase
MLKNFLKPLNKGIKLGISVLLFSQLNSCYLINQGYNLLKYNLSARPLEEVYRDPKVKDSIKERIKLVFEIREFAIKEFGLKQNKTYTKFVQLNDKNYLVNVLVASKPDKLEAYQWSFPFFGSFPYKGFYDLNEAKEEQKRLKSMGYDTYIRTAGAFSTLGWFDDPIYSYMLNYPTEYLANLIIHEMTHATVFIKDNIPFNEELASFVGDQGSVEFLKYKYGENSKEYKASFDIKEDNKIFSKYVNDFYNALNNLYNDPNKTREQKLAEKEQIIDDYRFEKFQQVAKTFKTKGAYSWFPKQRINNALVMGFITYEQDSSLYHKLFAKEGNDLRKTLEVFKTIEKAAPQNPKQFLKDYVEGKV